MLRDALGFILSARQPDWKRPETHTINLSGSKLEVSFPTGFDHQVAAYFKPVPTFINIHDQDLYDEYHFIELFKRNWYYAARFSFFPEPYCYLSFRIMVRRVENIDAFDMQSLETFIDQLLRSVYEKNNKKHISKGNNGLCTKLPEHYQRPLIDGKEGLQYHLGGKRNMDVYILPLTNRHIVEIYLDHSLSSSTGDPKWYEYSHNDAEKILSLIRLTRVDEPETQNTEAAAST